MEIKEKEEAKSAFGSFGEVCYRCKSCFGKIFDHHTLPVLTKSGDSIGAKEQIKIDDSRF